jgi:hypothetical protein
METKFKKNRDWALNSKMLTNKTQNDWLENKKISEAQAFHSQLLSPVSPNVVTLRMTCGLEDPKFNWLF